MNVREKTVRFKEIYCSLVAYIPVLIGGMQAGFPAFIIQQLKREIRMDEDQVSWLVSLGYFSLIAGPLASMYLTNKYGRKSNLRSILLLYVGGWSIILISTNFANLLIGFTLCGIAAGSATLLSTLYVSEICRAKYRGSLLSLVWLISIMGTSSVYTLEFYLPWRRAVFFIVILSVLGVVLLRNIPESKYWYLLCNQKEQAKQSATWFENTSVVRKEVDIIYAFMKVGKAYMGEEQLNSSSLSWKTIKNLKMKPFLLAVSVSVLRCGTGRILFTVYPVNLFADMHTPFNSFVLGMWFGLLNFLCCFGNIVIFSIIDKFNRKNFFYALSTIMIAALAVIITIESFSDSYFKPFPTLRVFCMYVYLMLETTGYFCITTIMVMEIIPMMQRGVGLCLVYLIANVMCAVYIKFFPSFEKSVSFNTMCMFFLVNVLLIAAIVRKYFPETRGRMYFGSENVINNAGNNNEKLDEMMKEDWFRNEQVQNFFTNNELFDIDKLDTEMLRAFNREWLERMKETMNTKETMMNGNPEWMEKMKDTLNSNQSFAVDVEKQQLLTVNELPDTPFNFGNLTENFQKFAENFNVEKFSQTNQKWMGNMKPKWATFGQAGMTGAGNKMFQKQQEMMSMWMQNIQLPSMMVSQKGRRSEGRSKTKAGKSKTVNGEEKII